MSPWPATGGRGVLLWCFPACTGVEGFANSAIQCELLARPTRADVTVVVVHAVNPSGMAWWRRQNENNVDLNRNCWWDFAVAPPNPGYAECTTCSCRRHRAADARVVP